MQHRAAPAMRQCNTARPRLPGDAPWQQIAMLAAAQAMLAAAQATLQCSTADGPLQLRRCSSVPGDAPMQHCPHSLAPHGGPTMLHCSYAGARRCSIASLSTASTSRQSPPAATPILSTSLPCSITAAPPLHLHPLPPFAASGAAAAVDWISTPTAHGGRRRRVRS